MKTILMKFGGSSIGITPGMTQLLSIVLHEVERWDQVILVVSALDGITDRLLEAAQFALLSNSRGYRRIVATLRARHFALIGDLPFGVSERSALQTDIDRILFDMHDACQQLGKEAGKREDERNTHPITDRIIGTGERLTARIVAALLRQSAMRSVAIDATDLVITDDHFGSATPLLSLTQARIDEQLKPLLGRGIVPVITGFIAATPTGVPTTLGRGGSDYTASVIAACVGAAEVWVYSDVDGIMSADPHVMADARVIETLSYEEAAELAFYGARVLHTRMIAPLQAGRIPLRVKNVFNPQASGTLIDERAAQSGAKAVTVIDGLVMTAARSGSLIAVTAFVETQFTAVTGGRIEAVLTAQSAARAFACFVIPTYAGPDALHMLQTTLAPHLLTLEADTIWLMQPVGVVSLVGGDVGADWGATARIVGLLRDLNVLAMTRNPSNCSLSFVLPPEQVERAVARIHAYIVAPS